MLKLLIIATGSVAVIKIVELTKLLNEFCTIKLILSSSAKAILSKYDIDLKYESYYDLLSDDEIQNINHIKLSRECDIILVCPASANLINKLSCGVTDDLATCTLLACQSSKKIYLAPAMNPEMWHNNIVQNSIKYLKSIEYNIIDPQFGNMKCGEIGYGRLEDLSIIANIIKSNCNNFTNQTAVITAGATIEPIDPIRYISNHSSGIQAVELAYECLKNGIKVIFIAGKIDCDHSLHNYDNITIINVNTAIEMHEAVMKQKDYDYFIGVAAVGDWRVQDYSNNKLKKNNNEDQLTINLVKNPDILNTVATLPKDKRAKKVVGFCAETNDIINNAKIKLRKKNCDLIIANHISDANKAFGEKNNQVYFINEEETIFYNSTKKDIAKKIVTYLLT